MSRSSLVAMLVAVEIVIVGIALYAVSGIHRGHSADLRARTFAPIDAGATPRIAVDDVDSRVVVAASSDGRVHVKDLTSTGGFFGESASIAQLDVKRVADGVSISRPESNGSSIHFGFGWSERRIEIDVPNQSHIDIARCAGAEISGVDGGVAVTSQDGRITLADLSGSVQARSNDGSVYASRIHGDDLALQSDDGRLSLTNVSASSLDVQTKSGSIEARDLAIAGGAQPHAALHTGDGSIRVTLAARADLTVDASTSDGKIIVDGQSFRNAGDGDSAQHTIRLGSGTGSLQLSSDDGSIHILTNGAV